MNDVLEVELPSGRRQQVFVDARSVKAIRFWSIILSPRATRELGGGRPSEYAWERNRLSDLMGFSVDGRGRLIGETWIADEAMTPDTLSLHVHEVARVCDWHEFRLSAKDEY
jgi:hypothetical protein